MTDGTDGTAAPGEIRVMLVDDEALMRSGLSLMLDGAAGMRVVAQAANGREAVHTLATRDDIDVVLMDIRMPVLDGIGALRMLPPSAPPVIVLTSFDTDTYVLDALRAGAAGFLLKSASPGAIVAAVAAAAEGQPLLNPEVLVSLVRLAGTEVATGGSDAAPSATPAPAAAGAPAVPARGDGGDGGDSAPAGPLGQLSAREREIAELVARGMSNPQIGATLFISLPTVKTHVTRIIDKLGVDNRVQVALAVVEDRQRPGTR
ncbi:response regulator transcription factor [Corynebacterium bovis]|uniref:response regulator transcription factor n=1 Tax=Corynebacterium bovis TaxID=36808 RepID=UPI000F6415AE|nr:response regulator transcription factor [Corynebacterium bovis]RRQ07368.1 DNA-binding response regulator [Corynebacterium bovis]RRQ08931.1 DNA-binding response regulator [Corynebacterium bovis]